MVRKLAVLEQCIQNDKLAIKELEFHLKKLYEMRDRQLEIEGIDKTEWEKAIKEITHG